VNFSTAEVVILFSALSRRSLATEEENSPPPRNLQEINDLRQYFRVSRRHSIRQNRDAGAGG
jgi:hypothetical protein